MPMAVLRDVSRSHPFGFQHVFRRFVFFRSDASFKWLLHRAVRSLPCVYLGGLVPVADYGWPLSKLPFAACSVLLSFAVHVAVHVAAHVAGRRVHGWEWERVVICYRGQFQHVYLNVHGLCFGLLLALGFTVSVQMSGGKVVQIASNKPCRRA